jgi:hypothetical protein
MDQIIPRWEWRTFGDNFGESESLIKQYQAKTRESSEIYILSSLTNFNTKIRDQLMDIKYLIQTNDDELEQWNPLIKAGFPIDIKNLRVVADSWRIQLDADLNSDLSYNDFMNKIVQKNLSLTTVNVFKERHGYKIDDCIVELAFLKFNTKSINTVAVEHEDPLKVMQTVKKLKLDGFENINYLKALKKFVGLKY